MSSGNHVLDEGVQRRHLANTMDRSEAAMRPVATVTITTR